ncbi:capsular polysaccharide export protein [Novosphingobium sp. PhB165]|uniref:capsular polysaccharide export protein, LipB/KpsS family n=1 Tax=Novosphingobium sp. PhB165 TaxID=2485105 RepID=UPI001049DBD8|nr:beta-3-deoxy-D-manno-oct-2-ulosonic acid transferase [Novosphingobium sp. PhB165]TCM20748.1 capsular polysaccharide export protein [Novosphingobium sp. PhB165]
MNSLPFLRIPPFPAHRAAPLAIARGDADPVAAATPEGLIAALREHRVGGSFWGAQAGRPAGRDVVLSVTRAGDAPAILASARESGLLDRAVLIGSGASGDGLPTLPANSDPWFVCAGAAQVIAAADDEIALVAAILGIPLTVIGEGRFATLGNPDALGSVLSQELDRHWRFRSPFDGSEIDALEAIAMLGRWRTLIDANRRVAAVHGIARWKRITADNLLWDGSGPVRHDRAVQNGPSAGNEVLAWIARSDAKALAALKAEGVTIGEIEDGMIRSTGLGANCVPPLSIVVDVQGPHFDPAQASSLETILQSAEIDAKTLARAATLRERLVRAGISKYGQDQTLAAVPEREVGRRVVLVTGQVEDDRSVLCGGAGLGNLELLRRARAQEPRARIIFKPHPDVEAGHRKGHVPDAQMLELADEIDRSSSIAALLDRVDAVHVLTSLAGFEALMRGREVVTHGVPFYAGWGLTRDLGPVPARRTRRRTLDELVAATLLLYPRYLDPVTRLPCEAEVLVNRIAAGQADVRSPLIRLREWQGRLNRLLGWRDRR